MNRLTIAGLTAAIIVIIVVTLVYTVPEPPTAQYTAPTMVDIPYTQLQCKVHQIENIELVRSHMVKIHLDEAPVVNSQLFINNMFAGNVAAYTPSGDKKILIMDRDVQMHSGPAHLITVGKWGR